MAGAILASSIAAIGSGYAVNDTGTFDGGNGDATYVIDGVTDPFGTVSVYHIVNQGSGYDAPDTADGIVGGAQPGSGSGFLISISSVSVDGGGNNNMPEPKTTNLGLNLSHPTSPDYRGEWPASMDENLKMIDTAVGAGGGASPAGADGDIQIKNGSALGSSIFNIQSSRGTTSLGARDDGSEITVLSSDGTLAAQIVPGSVSVSDGSGNSAGLSPNNIVINNAAIVAGTGSPEGTVTAQVGSLYIRTDGGTSTTLYVKESGTGTSGWVAK